MRKAEYEADNSPHSHNSGGFKASGKFCGRQRRALHLPTFHDDSPEEADAPYLKNKESLAFIIREPIFSRSGS